MIDVNELLEEEIRETENLNKVKSLWLRQLKRLHPIDKGIKR